MKSRHRKINSRKTTGLDENLQKYGRHCSFKFKQSLFCFHSTRSCFRLRQHSALSAFSPFSYLIRPRLGQSGLRDITHAALLVHFTNAGILRQIIIFVTIPVFFFFCFVFFLFFCFRSTSQTRPCALRMSRYVASIPFTDTKIC